MSIWTGMDTPVFGAEKAVRINWDRWDSAPKTTNRAPLAATIAPTFLPPATATFSPTPSISTDCFPLVEKGRRVRWRKSDERGCRKCKRCGGPIIWAQVIEDTDPKAKRGAWLKLDPDHLLHGCGGPRAGRFIDPKPKPTDGATNNGDK